MGEELDSLDGRLSLVGMGDEGDGDAPGCVSNMLQYVITTVLIVVTQLSRLCIPDDPPG